MSVSANRLGARFLFLPSCATHYCHDLAWFPLSPLISHREPLVSTILVLFHLSGIGVLFLSSSHRRSEQRRAREKKKLERE